MLKDLREYNLPEFETLELSNSKKLKAVILEPKPNLEEIREVHPALFLKLEIVADLYNVDVRFIKLFCDMRRILRRYA